MNTNLTSSNAVASVMAARTRRFSPDTVRDVPDLPHPDDLLPPPPPERDPSALLAEEPLKSYVESVLSAKYARRAGALGMLRLLDPIRTALRAYERQLVAVALREGATWAQIGDSLGMSRSNAYTRHKHVAAEHRESR